MDTYGYDKVYSALTDDFGLDKKINDDGDYDYYYAIRPEPYYDSKALWNMGCDVQLGSIRDGEHARYVEISWNPEFGDVNNVHEVDVLNHLAKQGLLHHPSKAGESDPHSPRLLPLSITTRKIIFEDLNTPENF